MFSRAFSAFRSIRPLSARCINAARILSNDIKPFSTINYGANTSSSKTANLGISHTSLISNKQILSIANSFTIPVRTVIKFSLKKGKRKTVKAVTKRFFRLHWGIWVRPMVGRQKRLWKKTPQNRVRLRQHVFTNSTQTWLLDKMVTKYWKKPKYYIDDPYTPYHTREEFPVTRKKPVKE